MLFLIRAGSLTVGEFTLDLATVDPDDAYAFTYPHLPERYEGIAAKFPGLPLLVVDRARRVVSGHDYLLLLRQRAEIQAQATQVDLAAADALFLNYNLLHHLFGLNLYEKLLFLKKISPWCPAAAIQRRADLNFTLNDQLLENLDLLLAEPFRFCLAAGHLGMQAALRLAAMAEEDRLAMLNLFRACKFSESQQAQVIKWLEESAFREKKRPAAILSAVGLAALLEGEMPQKKIIAALQARRFPACTQMEDDWQAWHKKTAPAHVSVAHAPFFAREGVQVTVSLKNRAAAEKLLAKLKKKK